MHSKNHEPLWAAFDALKAQLAKASTPGSETELTEVMERVRLELDRTWEEQRAAYKRSLIYLVPQVLIAVALLYLAVRYPTLGLPTLLGALIGHFHAASREASWEGLSVLEKARRSQRVIRVWAVLTGAISYASLAAMRVAIPATDASFGWRVFGGAFIGGFVGFVATLEILTFQHVLHVLKLGRLLNAKRAA